MKKLIRKFLSETITEEEKQKLKQWLTKPKNKTIFESYVRDLYLINSLYNDINIDAACKKVSKELSNTENSVKTIPLFKRSIFKYAAAILILVSIGYFFLNKENSPMEPNIVKNNIKPGTDKATLTLENGTNVILEKGQSYQTNNVRSNGEEIIYKADKIRDKISYNYLTIPRGGQFIAQLADGTKVWLNSETKLKFPEQFVSGKPRVVELVYGEAYFDVSHSSDHNGDSFQVVSQNQNIEVLGTEFNVKFYKEDSTIETILVKGKVSIDINNHKKELLPNQQLIYHKKTNDIELQEVDAANFIAWRRGVFKFERLTLFEVTKVLSRWYDVQFEFENEKTKSLIINGTLSKLKNIEVFLITLKNTNNINYKIDERTIYLK